MSEGQIVISGDVEVFGRFLDPKVLDATFSREIRKAMIKASLFLIKEVKQRIKDEKYEANSDLTLALAKKGNTPLYKMRNLVEALSYTLSGSFKAEVGHTVRAKTTGGVTGKSTNVQKAAELLHKGYTIRVTPKMRAAIFAALAAKGNSKGKANKAKSTKQWFKDKQMYTRLFGGGSSTLTWRVPPRPYLTEVWKDTKVQEGVRKIWREALEGVWQQMGAKDNEHLEKR